MAGHSNSTGIRRGRWPAFAAAVAFTLAFTAPAPAFYWLGWPGSGVQPPPGIVSDTVKVDHRNPPPPTNPPDTNPPGGGPENPPGHTNEVPEPASLLLAGAGLAAAGLRWARKRRTPNPGGTA